MGIKKLAHPEIKIHRLSSDLEKSIKIIHKFLVLNKIDLNYSITLDYKLDSYGEWNPNNKNEIKLNPSAFYDTSKEKPWAKYYTEDYSLMAVAIHEICHLLDDKFLIEESYIEEFPKPFYLNENSKKDRREEVAECLSLFVLVPFFLKLINKDVFKFFRNLFRSPTPCTKANFISRWKGWNPQIHQICLEKWGIKVLGDRVFTS